MVEKKEGATQTCSKCGTDLICKKITKTWNNKTEEKLQWQNKSDGNPHYKFAGEGKYDCNIPNDSGAQQVDITESTVTTNTASETTETQIPQMDKLTEGYVDKQVIYIQQVEQRVFHILGKDANVQKVGMYVKLILEGINRK